MADNEQSEALNEATGDVNIEEEDEPKEPREENEQKPTEDLQNEEKNASPEATEQIEVKTEGEIPDEGKDGKESANEEPQEAIVELQEQRQIEEQEKQIVEKPKENIEQEQDGIAIEESAVKQEENVVDDATAENAQEKTVEDGAGGENGQEKENKNDASETANPEEEENNYKKETETENPEKEDDNAQKGDGNIQEEVPIAVENENAETITQEETEVSPQDTEEGAQEKLAETGENDQTEAQDHQETEDAPTENVEKERDNNLDEQAIEPTEAQEDSERQEEQQEEHMASESQPNKVEDDTKDVNEEPLQNVEAGKEIEQTEQTPVAATPPAQDAEETGDVQVDTEAQDAIEDELREPINEEDIFKSNFDTDATATVKFMLMPSGQVVTQACRLGQTLDAFKADFSSELKVPADHIMLMFDGKQMTDKTTIGDLGVGPNGTIQLEMQSSDPINSPIKAYRPRQEYIMPDVITVRVMTEECESKDVVVEIERARCKKPFLGGFRNKKTGIEFHNASAQTMQKPRPPPTAERFCRDTQTCEQRNMYQQTTNTTCTQMTGVGIYISNLEDKLVKPDKYMTADEYWSMVLKNVIILQKYYRRWLAIRYVRKLKEDKARRLEWERQEELRKKREKGERLKREYARRINPKTKADFDMLLNCLEKWRLEEVERINSTLEGAERKAALCMLLDQESELLSAIERHKNDANLDNREKRIMSFLDKTAAAKKWVGHDGKLTFMDTPFTIRAKELRDIYNSINMKYLTQDERLDVLLTLKHTVKEHDCKLTQEIIELIDREADLLMRGVKEANLTGLRKRISTLFLQYIKTPTFNPEAAKLLKVPQDPSSLRHNINYCLSCGNYLPSTDFFITSNSRKVGRCRNCLKAENDGRQRHDHTYYRVMLKALRKTEESMQDGSSLCYLLQENDLRYLVENIWSGHSVLSAWDDLYDLVLVRWDKHQEWSPWNCILLTHDEAEAHKKLFSLEEGYGQVFIHKVTQKHNFARNYFSRLPGMSEKLREKLDPTNKSGPAVAGHSVPAKPQKV